MPPKKNKQTPKNAFYYFMLHFKETHGNKFSSMKDVADAAGPRWAGMNKDQRKPFENRALMEKNQMRAVKLTSDGFDVEELERQEREEQCRIQEMKDDINCNLRLCSEAGSIQDEMFFIIHVNIFCYCTAENRYYPAEIAVACFSLEDGVLQQNIFNRIIKPGPLPLGYASEAKLISEETHQLPPPLAGEDESNLAEVYSDLKYFLSTKLSGSKRFPPLYTDEKMLKMVQHILDTWCYDFGESAPLFKVYNLQYMFKDLKNIVANANVWPTDTPAKREVEKDAYAYTNGICCEFHDLSDVVVFCSRSIVVRYAYTICDNCCQDLGIILVPGTHIPDTSMTPFKGSRSSSRASSISEYSRSSSNLRPTIRDSDSDTVISFSSKSEWDNQSQMSESSNYSLDSDGFPGLGFKKKSASTNSQPHFSSNFSQLSQSSSRSYAGAMGTAGLSRRTAEAPSSICKDFDALSVQESDNGFVPSQRFENDLNNFPALGKGRGRRLN